MFSCVKAIVGCEEARRDFFYRFKDLFLSLFMNVLLLFIIYYCLMAREDPEAIFQGLFMVVNEKPSGLKGEGLLHRAKQQLYILKH